MNAVAYDVFNGDADGICALHQLRLASPRAAELVTGVKREIALLERVPELPGLELTVLDISLDANAPALARILGQGGRVQYFDHHSARLAVPHPGLDLRWDDAPEVCTSILVDRYLQGRFRGWAVAAACGDNLYGAGCALAADAGLDAAQTAALERLGTILNYNAYGECLDDLHLAPADLYRALHAYRDPFDFIAEAPEYRLLSDGYDADAERMAALLPDWEWDFGAIYVLPCECWAHRISGVYANRLSAAGMGRAFAVLSLNTDGSYTVSVRSGDPARRAAHVLCDSFVGGGGRRAAAGINRLPEAQLDTFARAFFDFFSALPMADVLPRPAPGARKSAP